MSSSNNNTIYKKTSFLAGNNSEFINEFYADYISDPNSLPESWRKFFDGLRDDENLVYDNLRGPSWSPEKKIRRPAAHLKENFNNEEISTDLDISTFESVDEIVSKEITAIDSDNFNKKMLLDIYNEL